MGSPSFEEVYYILQLKEACESEDLKSLNSIIYEWKENRAVDGPYRYQLVHILKYHSSRTASLDGEIAVCLKVEIQRISKFMTEVAKYTARTSTFQNFLDNGWDINGWRKNCEFKGPAIRDVLHSEELVKWFLQHGADPNMRDGQGISILARAAYSPGPVSILILLITWGAVLNGSGALQAAASGRQINQIEKVSFLLNLGADINEVQLDFNWTLVQSFTPAVYSTALHAATFVGNTELADFLLKKGADWRVMDTAGRTPAQLKKFVEEAKADSKSPWVNWYNTKVAYPEEIDNSPREIPLPGRWFLKDYNLDQLLGEPTQDSELPIDPLEFTPPAEQDSNDPVLA